MNIELDILLCSECSDKINLGESRMEFSYDLDYDSKCDICSVSFLDQADYSNKQGHAHRHDFSLKEAITFLVRRACL